jgi:hypothetical protein
MPQKRDVLAILTRDELLTVVDGFELAPPDRRAKDGLVETIAASKKATLPECSPTVSETETDLGAAWRDLVALGWSLYTAPGAPAVLRVVPSVLGGSVRPRHGCRGGEEGSPAQVASSSPATAASPEARGRGCALGGTCRPRSNTRRGRPASHSAAGMSRRSRTRRASSRDGTSL